ncbi:Pro-resilin-like 151 [Homarus americanus]|uniref:Pro-resilin-like 151 n=2 Tax=Homarus americanus TaxID=6706 RepID=A0A8J5MLR9_HOMAM|nr:Pro-resilin-like 151 [Homarus americanus]
MKTVAVVVVVSVVVAAWATPQFTNAPTQYSFEWGVSDENSGNFYGHREQRDGAGTQGSYYAKLPNGLSMKVQYTVDKSGFRPSTVTTEGQTQRRSVKVQRPTAPRSHPLSLTKDPITARQAISSVPNPATLPDRRPQPPVRPIVVPGSVTGPFTSQHQPSSSPGVVSSYATVPPLTVGQGVVPTGSRPPAKSLSNTKTGSFSPSGSKILRDADNINRVPSSLIQPTIHSILKPKLVPSLSFPTISVSLHKPKGFIPSPHPPKDHTVHKLSAHLPERGVSTSLSTSVPPATLSPRREVRPQLNSLDLGKFSKHEEILLPESFTASQPRTLQPSQIPTASHFTHEKGELRPIRVSKESKSGFKWIDSPFHRPREVNIITAAPPLPNYDFLLLAEAMKVSDGRVI